MLGVMMRLGMMVLLFVFVFFVMFLALVRLVGKRLGVDGERSAKRFVGAGVGGGGGEEQARLEGLDPARDGVGQTPGRIVALITFSARAAVTDSALQHLPSRSLVGCPEAAGKMGYNC